MKQWQTGDGMVVICNTLLSESFLFDRIIAKDFIVDKDEGCHIKKINFNVAVLFITL